MFGVLWAFSIIVQHSAELINRILLFFRVCGITPATGPIDQDFSGLVDRSRSTRGQRMPFVPPFARPECHSL